MNRGSNSLNAPGHEGLRWNAFTAMAYTSSSGACPTLPWPGQPFARAGDLSGATFTVSNLGGTCLNAGCIPTKTYLKSSKLLAYCRNGAPLGVRKGVEKLLKRSGVEVIRGHGRLESRTSVRAGQEVYPAKNILIATGSRPATPPIPGLDSQSVLDSTSVFPHPTVSEALKEAILGAAV